MCVKSNISNIIRESVVLKWAVQCHDNQNNCIFTFSEDCSCWSSRNSPKRVYLWHETQ